MEYKQKIKEIKKIVDRTDPAGLLAGGAPNDEYDDLTLSIMSVINTKNDIDITEKVISILESSFGKDNLQNKARSLGVADAVIFIGFQQNPLAYMKHCGGLLIPSRSEGLPITLLEAMVLGMPIIATNVGSIAQTLNGLDYGLVIDAHDDEAVIACLKNSMLRIMHDGKNERFSANMQDKVKRQYSCRSMEGQYNDFYCSLALD